MKVLLLQLSDIHFWASKPNPLSYPNRVESIVNAVQGIEAGVEVCFVLFNGDVAQAALPEEYKIADEFFDSLLLGLMDARPEWRIESLFVPGNHDCSLPDNDPVRQAMITEIFKDLQPPYRAQDSLIDFCLNAQDAFWNFEARRMNREKPLKGLERLFQKHEFELESHKIAFHLYNSAWLSRRGEKAGQLLMPLDTVPDAPECEVLVSLLHHPLNWLQPDNANAFRKFLERDSDFVMTGHEHESNGARKRTLQGAIVSTSEGAVLQEHFSRRSGFIAHVINFSSKEFRSAVYKHQSDPSRYICDSSESTGWLSLERNPLRRSSHLVNTWEYAAVLRDVGANFNHPAKLKISLDDLFIYPDFDIEERDQKSPILSILPGDRVLQFVSDSSEMIFFGSDRCGKTALGRKLYVDLQHQGFTPVFICGDEISSIKEKDFSAVINDAVNKQYGDKKNQLYGSIHHSKKVAILDNFHLASESQRQRLDAEPLNTKGNNCLIDILRDNFSKIILLSDDSFKYQEVNDESDEPSYLFDFSQCEFREMGHKQRGQIIEKWYALGRENSNDPKDTSYKIQQVENLINTLLGRDLIPKRPIFVIILLQQHESYQNTNTVNGSYGYYYQAIITAALEKTMRLLSGAVTRDLEMGMLQNVLSYIAFHMFSIDKKHLDDKEFIHAVNQYQSDFGVRFQIDHLKTILQHSQMMQFNSGKYAFTYPYLAPFFAARQITNGLNSDDTTKVAGMRDLLSLLISKLYLEDYSNILMFFLYFSKDRDTISDLVSVARSLFSEYVPFDIENHMAFAGRLHAEPVPLSLGDTTIKENQDSHRQKLDDENASRNTDESDVVGHDDNEDDSMLDGEDETPHERETREKSEETESLLSRAQTFNLALKTMQLMGQILRNFPGTLESEPKRVIATECELLGLRVLKAQFSHIEDNLQAYKYVFSEIVKNMHTAKDADRPFVDADVLSSRTDEMISRFLLISTYSSFKRISQSVGSEHLRETYKAIDCSISPVALELIHTSIKLDHFRDFPEDEVFALSKQLKRKRFSRDILRMLVRDRFLLRYEARVLRQKVCKELGIHIRSPKAFASAHKRLPN